MKKAENEILFLIDLKTLRFNYCYLCEQPCEQIAEDTCKN